MKISRALVARFVALAALVGFAAPGVAQSQLCRDICGPEVDCSTPCFVDGAQSFWTTCESSSCKHCTWTDVGQRQIGANQGGVPPLYCNYYVTFEVNQVNSCDGVERVICRHWQDGFGVNMDCCQAWGCWGHEDCP